MLEADRFHDVIGKAPAFQEHASDVGVGHSDKGVFAFDKREGRSLETADQPDFLKREVDGAAPDPMEQAGGVAFVGGDAEERRQSA